MTDDVDLDRLADYVGGALDGTPDAAAVAHLIATDPDWTSAHAALVAADAFVRADLAALAGEPEPMPDDVMAALSAAFAAEPPVSPQASEPPSRPYDSRPDLAVLPGGRATPTPSPRRRRWRTVIGVAAAAVVAGLGVTSLAPQLTGGRTGVKSDSAASTSQTGPRAGAPGADNGYAFGVTASGADYNAGSLSALGGSPVAAQGGGNSPKSESRPNVLEAPSRQATAPLAAVPEPLRPLTEPDARAACLKAVVAEYGGTVTTLDYARYQGSPALVILLDGAHGIAHRKWVVVVGPTCGTGGAIADERYSAQVG